MKKIFMAIVAMTMLIATSCKKENVNAPENLVPGEGEFLVTIANAPRQNAPAAPSDGMTVKTTIENGKDIIWTIGDEISINGVEYKTEMDGTSVIFKSKGGAAAPDGDGKYKAYYPADIAGGSLPATIAYDGGNLKNLPMYAESTDYTLTFNNICAALKITVPVACDKIVISANENLAGTFTIEGNGETTPYTAKLSTGDEGMSKTVTVNGTFAADGIVYVAIPAGTYTNFAVEFLNGQNSLMRRMLPNDLNLKVNNLYNMTFGAIPADAFCFTAKEALCTLKLTKSSKAPNCTFEYYDAGEGSWEPYTPGTDITLANVGDKAYFRAGANGNDKLAKDRSNFHGFTSSKKVAVSGNIMYLLVQTGSKKDLTPTTNDYAFGNLFRNMTNLVDASGLILPAETLAKYCYYNMFSNCSALTTAPNLPAITLAKFCYYQMFNGCSALTTAPNLPATTLAEDCYCSMFFGCSALTTAPNLPATTLANRCYYQMFYDCSALTTAPNLPATTLANRCYCSMFYGCSALTTAPDLPATTLADSCYCLMFYNCSALTTAPDLPATNMVSNCYASMFYGCTALTAVPNLHPEAIAEECYRYMFCNCSKLGVSESPITGAKTTLIVPAGASGYGWNSSMFAGTGGTYTQPPTAGNTYYFYDASQH